MATILIVEDKDSSMRLFHDVLLAKGHTVLQAGDGLTGLNMVLEKKPDLVIMDIQLPKLSGTEVISRLKADASVRHIPILAISAMAMDVHVEKIRASGCDDFLAKPFQVLEFLARVEALLPA